MLLCFLLLFSLGDSVVSVSAESESSCGVFPESVLAKALAMAFVKDLEGLEKSFAPDTTVPPAAACSSSDSSEESYVLRLAGINHADNTESVNKCNASSEDRHNCQLSQGLPT